MIDIDFSWTEVRAAIWRHHRSYLKAVRNLDPIEIDQLLGIERQKQQLLENTRRFIAGEPANNVLLWGARGTGKSSLIKAVFNHFREQNLRLIQVDKAGLIDLPELTDALLDDPDPDGHRFIIFCDDLSFDDGEGGYRELKSLLEGSIEVPPENVLVYATSNRRHLVPESMQDNQATQVTRDELHYADAVEEKISLSDRFGLWLSFYSINQDEYLAIIDMLFGTVADQKQLHIEAARFATQRGVRSGRVARQFYNEAVNRFRL